MAESLVLEPKVSQKKVDINVQIDQVLTQVRELGIMVPNSSALQRYLSRYPDIVDMIIPICKQVKGKFKYPSQISLELYRDPEIVDEYITIYVRQRNYDESVMNRIEEIEAKYEKELIDKKGWIIITTDFQQPR
jgi:hypothetical protein